MKKLASEGLLWASNFSRYTFCSEDDPEEGVIFKYTQPWLMRRRGASNPSRLSSCRRPQKTLIALAGLALTALTFYTSLATWCQKEAEKSDISRHRYYLLACL